MVFSCSHSRGKTFDFTLGEQDVIKGVDMGMLDMCVGEKRRLTIPAILGYGARGLGTLALPHTHTIYDVFSARISLQQAAVHVAGSSLRD